MPDFDFDPTDSEFTMQIAEFEVEHEDVFHLKKLYALVAEWFAINGYVSVDSNDDKIETLYWERKIPSGAGEYHIWWRVHKIPRDNNYYKYYIRFDFQGLNVNKKEVVHQGNKVGTNQGDIILRCKAFLILDRDKEWREHKILKHFHRYYLKRLYKKQLDFIKGELWTETYRLQGVIKQYMQLRNPHELPQPFHNVLGL